MYYAGLTILKEEAIPLKRLLLFAIPTAICVEIARSAQIVFGLHVFVVLLSSTLFGRVILRLELSKALLASLLGMIFLLTVESLTYPLFSRLLQDRSFFQDEWYSILFGWTSIILLIGVSDSVRYARKRFRTE
ncbi:hypothetical protein GTO91_16485 [Heliobacterium undosum]|uniref:Uncharacterized protein n=2 Tax=Heliomicrobium undosum TaxID=121734 RepID=A0A845L6I2_9FIRM|nr:hypothetical protein [Heliomicrobium undosum]